MYALAGCREWPHTLGANATRRANALLDVLVQGASPQFRVRLVDCGHRFVNEQSGEILERLMPDHIHPSRQGFAVWDACLHADV